MRRTTINLAQHYRLIYAIGIIEILVGSTTVLFNLITLILGSNYKSPNILIFVITAGITSSLIGLGVLNLKKSAYQLLFYFSSVIVFSKFLIFLDVISLNGDLETTISAPLKNIASFVYHSFVLFYLNRQDIKQAFHF